MTFDKLYKIYIYKKLQYQKYLMHFWFSNEKDEGIFAPMGVFYICPIDQIDLTVMT